jgi:2'-5' RNA ligase
VLYVGACSPDEFRILCNVVRDLARKLRPFQIDLSNYGEFTSTKGMKIAHMKPSLLGQIRLAALHGLIRRALEQFGKEIQVKHTYGVKDKSGDSYEAKFLAHATLAYLPPDAPYVGPKPTGSWTVNEIECWGHEKIRVPLGKLKVEQPTGLMREPLALSYPMAVPNLERSTLEWTDRMPGGLADKSKPEDFDPEQLAIGTDVELEHVKDRKLAQEIAMDHLRERKDYYSRLKRAQL